MAFTVRLAGMLLTLAVMILPLAAQAHRLRQRGVPVAVAESTLIVTPSRDWNQLSFRIGRKTETWTLDGEFLNDVTFFGGIEPGNPLIRERSKTREPLPKFTQSTLLAEVPELLERTSRAFKHSGSFQVTSVDAIRFLDRDGVSFAYQFTDEDQLTRRGEGRATIVDGKLYMITFEAPRLSYFAKNVADFRQLADSATLNQAADPNNARQPPQR